MATFLPELRVPAMRMPVGTEVPVPAAAAAPAAPAAAAAPAAPAPAVVERRFQAVYAEHLDSVWRSLRSLGVPPCSVEDAAQDVFLVVHRRLAEFGERSAMRTWIFGIVLHVARNYRRRERRKGGLSPLDTELAGHGPGPERQAETAEALELVADALGDLDETRREVLVLGELEQMTAPEIAEALGINVNTVYSRLRAANLAFTAALARRRGALR